MKRLLPLLCLALAACSSASDSGSDDGGVDLHVRALDNRTAYIPPQCYTKTSDSSGGAVANPCYVCHATARGPNMQSQPELQLSYALPQVQGGHGVMNPWTNLFVDRHAAIGAISDEQIRHWVASDNYHSADGGIAPAARLAALPKNWDVNNNGRWDGYTPDAAFNFDAQGYDIRADGRETGWRAYAYYPFPGAFMPTNGAFDDVLIRLPAAFREREDGSPDRSVYTVNLAIVQALLLQRDVAIDSVDEQALGVDLDHDGKLAQASRIVYDWAPTQGRNMSYVGLAGKQQQAGQVHLAGGLLPEGTEFLHSVRYLETDAEQQVRAAPRMKELRYARKKLWLSYSDLQNQALLEAKEDALNPDRATLVYGDAETGVDSTIGWVYQGFIEDRSGQLRPQTYEESVYCIGCHSRLSATADGNFSMPRKRDAGPARGWYRWSGADTTAIADPLRSDGQPEYASYLRAALAGDEFRANDEVRQRFFNADGSANTAAFAQLSTDLSTLLIPSTERALLLDKAYRVLVSEQSFTRGRDALPAPPATVWQEIEPDHATGIIQPLQAPPLAGDAASAVVRAAR